MGSVSTETNFKRQKVRTFSHLIDFILFNLPPIHSKQCTIYHIFFVYLPFSMCLAIFITYSDEEDADPKTDGENSSQRSVATLLLEIPQNTAIEHKKGYMMRKCCYESNHKKSTNHSKLTFNLVRFLLTLRVFFSFYLISSFWKTVLENVFLYAKRSRTVYA